MDPWEDSLIVYVYSAPDQYYQMEGKKSETAALLWKVWQGTRFIYSEIWDYGRQTDTLTDLHQEKKKERFCWHFN